MNDEDNKIIGLKQFLDEWYGVGKILYKDDNVIFKRVGFWAPSITTEELLPLVSCQCGSDKAGMPGHSRWCPKHMESV